jgi:hypothetical protein
MDDRANTLAPTPEQVFRDYAPRVYNLARPGWSADEFDDGERAGGWVRPAELELHLRHLESRR